MTTQQDEHFSALIDGELDDANTEIIINQLCKSETDKQRWHRYHLISDTLHSTLPESIHPAFSRSVMAAIESEPAILAPKNAVKSKPHHILGRRAASAALAATVAMVAVFAVKTNVQQDEAPQLAQMPSNKEFVRLATQTPEVMPLVQSTPAMTVSSSSSTTSTQTGTAPVFKIDPRLHQYIMNHSQRVSGGQLQGILPYARLVVVPTPTTSQGAGQK